MRPRHKPGCTAFFILLLRAVSASGCKPAPDGGPSRPVGSLSAVSVSGCPRSPTVSGRGLLRFSAVPVPRRFPDADCTCFRLSPSSDGFRLRFAFGWLFSGGALPAAATARSALLRLCRFIPICCCTRPKDLMKKITLISFCLAAFAFASCAGGGCPATGIIPAPQQVTWGEGAFRMPAKLLRGRATPA